jgi:hypothetical protein
MKKIHNTNKDTYNPFASLRLRIPTSSSLASMLANLLRVLEERHLEDLDTMCFPAQKVMLV